MDNKMRKLSNRASTRGPIQSTINKTPSTSDEARASIDNQIKYLEESICSLKSARNRLAPISKMPPELLSLIFKLATGGPYPKLPGGNSHYEGIEHDINTVAWRGLNMVTGIYRSWRQVALECPSLWSGLILSGRSTHALEEMVLRSKASPLFIRLTNQSIALDKLPPPLIAKILTLERIRELHVVLPEEKLQQVSGSISGTTAPNMQSLLIRNIVPRTQSAGVGLSTKLLSIPMPNLRRLDIGNCNIVWDALKTCVSHELVSMRLSHVTQPSRACFFDLLSRTPGLEVLHLDSALPPISLTDLRESVELRRLTSCTLRFSTLPQCLDFQAHVSYPVTGAKLHFHPTIFDRSLLEEKISVAALLTSCGMSVDNPKRAHSCMLVEHIRSNIGIVLWDDEYKPRSDYLRSEGIVNPTVKICLETRRHATKPPVFVLDLLSMSGLDMFSVRDERHSAREMFPSAAWSGFFKRHTNITQLHMRCVMVAPVLTGLWTNTIGPENQPDSILHLPKLSILTLEDHIDGGEPNERTCILDLLGKYNSVGPKVSTLNLFHCHGINEDALDNLADYVDEVDWDEHYFSDEHEPDPDNYYDEEDDFDDYSGGFGRRRRGFPYW